MIYKAFGWFRFLARDERTEVFQEVLADLKSFKKNKIISQFQHAKEISNMAIRLMQEVSGFKVLYFSKKSSTWKYQPKNLSNENFGQKISQISIGCSGFAREKLQDADANGNPLWWQTEFLKSSDRGSWSDYLMGLVRNSANLSDC